MSQRPAIERFRGEYEWLSNFSPATVMYGKFGPFPTVEHAYQFAKLPRAVLQTKGNEFVDKLWTKSAAQAKAFGKELRAKGAEREDWHQEDGLGVQLCERVMEHLLWEKFAGTDELREKLLRTGTAELVEGNVHHDNFWGDCRCNTVSPEERGKFRPLQKCHMRGLNKLGKLIMEVRHRLAVMYPYRCPTCGSPEKLAQMSVVPVLTPGHFHKDTFIFDPADPSLQPDWDHERPQHSPTHYWCLACKLAFEVPPRTVELSDGSTASL